MNKATKKKGSRSRIARQERDSIAVERVAIRGKITNRRRTKGKDYSITLNTRAIIIRPN